MSEDDLLLFLRIAALQSLSGAARELRLSPAVVSHRLAQLEQQLGTRLFQRSTRQLSLTVAGQRFLPQAESIYTAMQNARAEVSGSAQPLGGVLRVTCSVTFGRQHLMPLLALFLQRYPQLNIDLHFSDHVTDLIADNYDVGIRIAQQIDSGLVARKLAVNERILCASPSYLAQHGTPATPTDLHKHDCLILHNQRVWQFIGDDGMHAVNINGKLFCNHGESLREAAVLGLGISAQAIWNIYRQLSSGELQPVLQDYPLAGESAIWAVYPSNRLLAQKVRVFIDFLLEQWQTPPWQSPT